MPAQIVATLDEANLNQYKENQRSDCASTGMADHAKTESRFWRRFLLFSVRGLMIVVLVMGIWLG